MSINKFLIHLKTWENEKINKAFISESLDLSISMAGAEGFEPSTNGFGDHYFETLLFIKISLNLHA